MADRGKERQNIRQQLAEWTSYTPEEIEEIKAEADEIINKRSSDSVFSVQDPASDEPRFPSSLLWWTGVSEDGYIPVAKYMNPKRQLDLRAFTLVSPLVLNAMSVLAKKCQSLQWYVEAGRNLANKWHDLLHATENGKGWDRFIAKWVRAYSESDRGGYAELVRAAPSWAVADRQLTDRGEAALARGADISWPVADLRVLDPTRCYPTTSSEFPLVYDNLFTGKRHRLRNHQYMHLLDMPGVDANQPGMGVCSVSRAVWGAQIDNMVNRYIMEKMSENPGAGIVQVNASPKLLETALNRAKMERKARGVVYYKGLIFLPVLDPSGSFSMELLPFSNLPNWFDWGQTYNILKEVVSAAFGIDVLELGSMPGNQLGSAQQATVMAKKSRGKGVGTIAQGVERQFRYKLLPAAVQFKFASQDLEEKFEKAEVDNLFFKNAALMLRTGGWEPGIATQYLVDMEAVPKEYLNISGGDLTPQEIIADVEGVRKWDRRVRVYRDGTVTGYRENLIALKMITGKPLAPATPHDAEVTKEDIDRANAKWGRDFPEFEGLLDAE